MSDLIKREDAMAIAFKSPFFSNALMEEFKTIPTIDAVSVVRCKECKYYAEHNELYINEPTTCVKHSAINHYVVVDADDFCSYGERSRQ